MIFFLKLFSRCISFVPAPLLETVGAFLGLLIYLFIPYRRHLIRFQIRMVYKKYGFTDNWFAIEKLVIGNYIHYGKLIIELILLISINPKNVKKMDKMFCCDNIDELKETLSQQRNGVVLTGGHVGLWEAIGPFLSRHDIPVTVAVKSVKISILQKVRELFQAHAGISILAPSAGRKRAVLLLKSLRENNIAGIFLDQYRSGEPFIPFLQFDARTNSTASVLHIKTGAPIFVIHVIRKSIGNYRIDLSSLDVSRAIVGNESDKVNAISLAINNAISEAIMQNPTQWLWAHRRFKENDSFREAY